MLAKNREVHSFHYVKHSIKWLILSFVYFPEIIMTYYEEKEKQNHLDELQIIKDTLLEENEKIKKFKEALKDKLIIYQQRIQFLQVYNKLWIHKFNDFWVKISLNKDTELWPLPEIQSIQSNTIESTENCTE